MRRPTSAAVALLVAATAALSTPLVSVAGQSKKPVSSAAAAHPDLNGVWSYATATPLQRPKALAGKAVLTDREAADF
jgi:hypothetical protein